MVHQKGFTLLEVMLVMVILATAAVALRRCKAIV
ncbi:prepilin-type N-terminal cleavage/methylation domain-containing protein [unidentified bacterial endosymbiont]|nr:prepilin-type N-terminal cleavage/methylation domain-containing protein [unidentified bacterial endosymbiont]